MAFAQSIVHQFVSAVADSGDATLLQPSNWNDTHTISQTGVVSGGIRYGTSTTTEDYSLALAANSLVIGGGAGTAPFTSANLTFGPTAGQGITLAAGTATTDVNAISITQTWNNASVAFTHEKHVITNTASDAASLALQYLGGAAGSTNLLKVDRTGQIGFGASVGFSSTTAGVGTRVQVTNTTWGAFAGIEAQFLCAVPTAFASLPATPQAGTVAYVTDSSTATWGATIAGSGANKVLAWYNGTNWTVAGA